MNEIVKAIKDYSREQSQRQEKMLAQLKLISKAIESINRTPESAYVSGDYDTLENVKDCLDGLGIEAELQQKGTKGELLIKT